MKARKLGVPIGKNQEKLLVGLGKHFESKRQQSNLTGSHGRSAVMSRRKARVPFVASVAVPPVKISEAEWSRLEHEFGSALSGSIREKILGHTQHFVEMAINENAAQPLETAIKRVRGLRKSAQGLLNLLDQARSLIDSPAVYADELIADYLYEKILPPALALLPIKKEVQLFEKACASALAEMVRDQSGKGRYWSSGWAWSEWIKNLTGALAEHQLPTSVRKDTDKNKTRMPSPFARFVIELQKSVPKQCRRYSTEDAISQAIIRARSSGNKPNH